MSTVPLTELAGVIRSKNAGPYELTLDVFFKTGAIYARAKERDLIDAALVRRLYGVTDEQIVGIVWVDAVRAVKVTIARAVPSGHPADTDTSGAQQHMPLALAMVEWQE